MTGDTSIESLKGIGEKTAGLFHKLNIYTIRDLVQAYPRDYDVFEEISPISAIRSGERVIIKGQLVTSVSEKITRRIKLYEFSVADATGMVRVQFFNTPYIKNQLKKGMVVLLRGKCELRRDMMFLEHPIILSGTEYEEQKEVLQPIYGLTAKLSNKVFKKAVKQALAELEIPEYLPDWILEKYHFRKLDEAIHHIHFPENAEELQNSRHRLVFDEFFLFLLCLHQVKHNEIERPNQFQMIETADTARLIEALPYRLTEDQMKVYRDLQDDLCGPNMMNRLVQGDVGSGKTILATLALVTTAANGYQGALMAPTEVLAKQHFDGISKLAKEYHLPLKTALLTGSMTAKQKKEVYERIEKGQVNCIIGTHALFQEKVTYQKLALVITDEQHRFGVLQREALAAKGYNPHVCVMSATPIPRTLSMILYGNFHVSAIRHLPEKRLVIKNSVVDISYREKAYQFIYKHLKEGEQAFIICPMIESSEDSNLESVMEYAKKCRDIFPEEIRIGVLHGQLKPAEKNQIMEQFALGNIHLLISTTVVEVGVNVPNATVMMIENADRFGLAQLHQLRGRVGRGEKQSYCIFINTSKKDLAKKRLKVLQDSNDGFFIAEQDLKLRGPGDFFGVRQSGEMLFDLADILSDAEELTLADEISKEILEIENWQDLPEYKALALRTQQEYGKFIDFPTI